MKENKLLPIDQLLTKELIVFMLKQKNGKNLKTNLNTIPETILFLFQRNILSTVCQQAISHCGPAYSNCIPFDLRNKNKVFDLLLLIFINIF